MNIIRIPNRIIAAALLSGGVAVGRIWAGVTATAHATPSSPRTTSRNRISGVRDNRCRRQTSHWDTNICHTWFWVPVGGMGNVGEFVFDGPTPPPHGPPPCYGAPICLPGL